MSTWTNMTAAEKTSAAETAMLTMSVSEVAAHFKTTRGAVAGALYRERRLSRRKASAPGMERAMLEEWAVTVGAAFGVGAKRLLDMGERRSLYRGVRHILLYLLAQTEGPATFPGPHGSWRNRRDSDGMSGVVGRAFGCSPSSVQEALKLVEDMRDDDPAIDAKITELEQRLGLA